METNSPYHVEVLNQKLKDIKVRNPNYSLRAFAKNLKIDPSSMSKILNGKRNIPSSNISDTLTFLNLSKANEKKFINSISATQKDKVTNQTKTPTPIVLDESIYSEIIRNWKYYAILNLIELDNFIPTYTHVSKRLGLTLSETKKMIQLLMDVNLIEKNDKDEWKRTYRSITTSNEVPSTVLKEAHLEEFNLAKAALYERSISETGFYSITVNSNQDTIAKVKKKCFNFLKRTIRELESDAKEDVYQIGLQLFPLTKKDKK